MGFQVRKASVDGVLAALVAAHNNTRRSAGVVASFFHADITSDGGGDFRNPTVTNATITATNAADLPTSLVLLAQIRQRWLQHRDDDLAHKIADGTPALTAPAATDLATAITLSNEIKADYNTHIATTTYHYTADSTNATAATNASDLATLITLLNEIKGDFNAHIVSAPVGQSVRLLES